jgi:hypothetical protein
MKPGKPLTFATLSLPQQGGRTMLVFGLPGAIAPANEASASHVWLASTLVDPGFGAAEPPRRPALRARLVFVAADERAATHLMSHTATRRQPRVELRVLPPSGAASAAADGGLGGAAAAEDGGAVRAGARCCPGASVLNRAGARCPEPCGAMLRHAALAARRLCSDIKLDPERPEYHRCTLVWAASPEAAEAASARAEGVGGAVAPADAAGGAALGVEALQLWAVSTGNQISSRLLSARCGGVGSGRSRRLRLGWRVGEGAGARASPPHVRISGACAVGRGGASDTRCPAAVRECPRVRTLPPGPPMRCWRYRAPRARWLEGRSCRRF